MQADKPSPHLGRRGLAAIGNIIIISIVGEEVCVDMMIHPDRIEMSTGGLGCGQEGGEAKAKEGTFFFLRGGCPFHRLMLYVWGRSVAITLTIWRRTAVYYYYLSSPIGDNNFVFFLHLIRVSIYKKLKEIYYLI